MAVTTREKVVWNGPKPFRRMLVAVGSLEPFPDNPNRGDVQAVAASYARFGQLKTIVVDGTRIVAGHTQTEAAKSLGWTHIAAVDGELPDEEEARAFLLADNRTGELGRIDEAALARNLSAIQSFDGVGYSAEFRADLEARLAQMQNPIFSPSEEPPPALDARSGTSGFFEVPLLLDKDDRRDFAGLVKMHRREWEIDDLAKIVMRLLRESAANL